MMDNESTPTMTLTFPLPMYEDDARTALDGGKWKLVAWDMDQHLRSLAKYSDDAVLAGHADGAREQLREIIDGRGLVLE